MGEFRSLEKSLLREIWVDLPVFLDAQGPESVDRVDEQYTREIVSENLFEGQGAQSQVPATRGLGPDKVDEGQWTRKNECVLKHRVSQPPAVVQLQNRLQRVWQSRTVIVLNNLLLVPQDGAVSLGPLGCLLLRLRGDLFENLRLLALVILRGLATTHV